MAGATMLSVRMGFSVSATCPWQVLENPLARGQGNVARQWFERQVKHIDLMRKTARPHQGKRRQDRPTRPLPDQRENGMIAVQLEPVRQRDVLPCQM